VTAQQPVRTSRPPDAGYTNPLSKALVLRAEHAMFQTCQCPKTRTRRRLTLPPLYQHSPSTAYCTVSESEEE